MATGSVGANGYYNLLLPSGTIGPSSQVLAFLDAVLDRQRHNGRCRASRDAERRSSERQRQRSRRALDASTAARSGRPVTITQHRRLLGHARPVARARASTRRGWVERLRQLAHDQAPAGSPGSFKIFAGGVSSSNFDITFVPGTLLVTAANNSLPPVPFSMDQGDAACRCFPSSIRCSRASSCKPRIQAARKPRADRR